MSKRSLEQSSDNSNKKQKTIDNDKMVQNLLKINKQVNLLICKNLNMNDTLNNLLKENRKLIDSLCSHNWVVDYEGCWGPSDRTPKICSKCGL